MPRIYARKLLIPRIGGRVGREIKSWKVIVKVAAANIALGPRELPGYAARIPVSQHAHGYLLLINR